MTLTHAETLRSLHAPCDCELPIPAHQPILDKDNLTVIIDGTQIALDCDECDAFDENTRRPDLIGIRTCNGTDEWLVIELKATMRDHGASQAAAGLEQLGNHRLFPMHISNAAVIFVVNKINRAALTILNAISPIEAGNRAVIPQIVEAGGLVECPRRPAAPPPS